MNSVESIIELYGMSPLDVEGGYFVETYRAGENVGKAGLPERYEDSRDFYCKGVLEMSMYFLALEVTIR